MTVPVTERAQELLQAALAARPGTGSSRGAGLPFGTLDATLRRAAQNQNIALLGLSSR